MLVKICVDGTDSTLNMKSQITVTNNDLSIRYFLKTTKQDNRPNLSYTNLEEVLVISGSYSITCNLDLECLEQVNVSELRDSLKD